MNTIGHRTVLAHLVLGLVCPCAPFTTPSLAAAAKRPNFVFFLTDDQPYNGMSCTGNAVLKTPNMDRLATEGVLFERAFVTTPICSCSRASIYTGQHMRRHGIRDFETPLSASQFRQTFPALLRDAGYRTAFLGKYAIGTPKRGEEALPAGQFDCWYGFPQNIAFRQRIDGTDRYLTTVMTEKAVGFLKALKEDQPFCLIMALKEPHGPLDYFDPEFKDAYAGARIPMPPNMTQGSFDAVPQIVRDGLNASPEWLRDPARAEDALRKIYAYISRADLAIGQICSTLAALGIDGETVIISLSDNGSLEGAHGLSGKWLMYEESIHVPMIIHDPRLPAALRGRRQQMALNIDVAPTILSMAGVPIPAGMQGADLGPILRDRRAKGREDCYFEHVYTTPPSRRPIPRSEGIRTDRWKYIRYTDPRPPLEQLFDLSADPREEDDLARDPAHSRTLEALRSRCEYYRDSLK